MLFHRRFLSEFFGVDFLFFDRHFFRLFGSRFALLFLRFGLRFCCTLRRWWWRRCFFLRFLGWRCRYAQTLQSHLLFPFFDAVSMAIQIPVLIENQRYSRRIQSIRFLQCGRRMHFMFGTLNQYTAVFQRDSNAAHLRILETFQIVVDFSDFANRFRFYGQLFFDIWFGGNRRWLWRRRWRYRCN